MLRVARECDESAACTEPWRQSHGNSLREPYGRLFLCLARAINASAAAAARCHGIRELAAIQRLQKDLHVGNRGRGKRNPATGPC